MLLFSCEGRLGNQLFQIAFLRTIAAPMERIVCANMQSFMRVFDLRDPRLVYLNNRLAVWALDKIVVPFLLRPLARLRIVGIVHQLHDGMQRPLPEYERIDGVLPIILVERNFYQSESLFDPTAAFDGLRFQDAHVDAARDLLKKVPVGHSLVAVHVRRTDYLSQTYLGVRGWELPESFYRRAMHEIESRVQRPWYVFLSDDHEYTKAAYADLANATFSSLSMGADLAVMSLCNAAIISNSSFSWWGAALRAEKGPCIAPMYWVGWKSRVDSHPGIQPQGSIQIDPAEPLEER